MHRISGVPFRVLLHSSISISQARRTLCKASSTSTPDTRSAKQLMDDPTNKHIRDEYRNAAGEVVFENDLTKPMTDDDWRQFEAAFGLDKPIPPKKIREWEAMTTEVENLVKEEELPLGLGYITMEPSDHQTEDPKQEDKVERKGVKKRPPRRDALSLKAAEVENGLRQPLHRRPGYEKRVASMEAEMTRLVTDVLIERTSDWYSSGADIQRVMLSPNLRNLTIYYSVDDEAQHIRRKEWRKLNKAMAARIHKEIFEKMDVRYAPTVFFERVGEEKASTDSALDAAFAQIEAERLANSTKPA